MAISTGTASGMGLLFVQSFAALDDGLERYVITINSLSKTYAMTGFRVGYICANERIMQEMIKLREALHRMEIAFGIKSK